jgi:hypothetical protein
MAGTSWFDVARYVTRVRTDISVTVTHWTKDRDGVPAYSPARCWISGQLSP